MSARIVRAWLYLALLALTASLVVYWWPELTALWSQQWHTYLLATGLMALATFVQARNFLVFMPDRPASSVPEMVRIWAWGALVNYAAPFQAGVVLRVYALHRQGIAIRESLAGTWRQLIASIVVSILGVVFALLLIDAQRYVLHTIVLLAGLVVARLLRRAVTSWIERCQWPPLLARKGWLLAANERFPLSGWVGVGLQYAIGTLLLLYVYRAFGADIGVGQALLMACAVYVSTLVAVLPGNFGILEGIYSIGGHVLGLGPQEAIGLALLLRAAHITSCLLLAMLPQAWFDRFKRA